MNIIVRLKTQIKTITEKAEYKHLVSVCRSFLVSILYKVRKYGIAFMQAPLWLKISFISIFISTAFIFVPTNNVSISTTGPSVSEITQLPSGDFPGLKSLDSNLVTQTKADTNFSLEIPGIGLEKGITANVNPGSKAEYLPIMTYSIAHGKYTKLPDEAVIDGNVYLFAHRNGEFAGRDIGFFNRLDELKAGDMAIINYNGERYFYRFKESFIITPQDTWVYTGNSQTPTLTLQTCENGEELRLMVKFDLVKVSVS